MTERFCLLTCAIFIVSGSLCVFGLDKSPLDANEIIRRYRESLSYAERISVKIDMEIHGTDETLSDFEQSFIRSRQTNIVYRRDHDRTEWIGNNLVLDQKGIVDVSKSFVTNEVMTGEYDGHVIGKLNELPIRATISKDYQDRQKALFNDPEHGGVLFGKIFGNNHKSVAELLAGATELRLRDVQQDIGDTSCYVLEATTEYGKVTAWIAPEKGYNALKWTIHKTSGDLYDEKPLFTSLTSWTAVFDDVELQKVDDMFITTGGTWTHTRNSTDGHTSVSHYKYKVGEVDLNPDFEALGAFVFNVPNGTPVAMEEFPGIGYIWQDGKPVTVVDQKFLDVLDNQIGQIKDEVKAESERLTDKEAIVAPGKSASTVEKKSVVQDDAAESQRKVLLESRPFPVQVLIPLGLLIIGIIVWRVFLLKGRQP
jgi:hypothetical protein